MPKGGKNGRMVGTELLEWRRGAPKKRGVF